MDRFSAMLAFVRIVERGSLSAAARSLGTTQPSVSRQLRALERRFKAQLLRRSTRHISLTEVGQAYYENCRRILADVDATEGNLVTLHTGLRGTLRVNTSVALGVSFVAPLACEFQRRHPDLTIDLTLNERFVDLIEEGIDVAIRFGQLRDEGLIARQLGSTRLLTVAAPAYLRRHRAPRRPEELASHTCVSFNYAPGEVWSYRGPEGDVQVRVKSALRSNNGHAIREALLSAVGIGWLPEALICGDIEAGKLKVVLPGYEMSPIAVNAVYSAAVHIPAKVRAFVGFLETQFAGLSGFARVSGQRMRPSSASTLDTLLGRASKSVLQGSERGR
jgi:DNA-binding transcriptional LysR family regulator